MIPAVILSGLQKIDRVIVLAKCFAPRQTLSVGKDSLCLRFNRWGIFLWSSCHFYIQTAYLRHFDQFIAQAQLICFS